MSNNHKQNIQIDEEDLKQAQALQMEYVNAQRNFQSNRIALIQSKACLEMIEGVKEDGKIYNALGKAFIVADKQATCDRYRMQVEATGSRQDSLIKQINNITLQFDELQRK